MRTRVPALPELPGANGTIRGTKSSRYDREATGVKAVSSESVTKRSLSQRERDEQENAEIGCGKKGKGKVDMQALEA